MRTNFPVWLFNTSQTLDNELFVMCVFRGLEARNKMISEVFQHFAKPT